MSDTMSDKRIAMRRARESRVRPGRASMKRKVSFRITSEQSEELDRLIKRGMNPSSTFRQLFDNMLFTQTGKRRRF